MRGRHRSRTIESVVAEVRALVAEGVKEINLISQDTTYFGMDLWAEKAGPTQKVDSTRGPTLTASSRSSTKSTANSGSASSTPTPPIGATIIAAIAASRHVCRYIDIPLQHIHPRMLQLMRRETTSEHIETLLARIRRGIPGSPSAPPSSSASPARPKRNSNTSSTSSAAPASSGSESSATRRKRVRVPRRWKASSRRRSKPPATKRHETPAAHRPRDSQAQVGRTLRCLTTQPLVARATARCPRHRRPHSPHHPAPVGQFIDVQITGTQVL